MVNQILELTEEWLSKELLSLAPSLIWSEAEQKEIDEIHDVKRWFDFLKEKGVIPNHFRLEAFTIPRLDSFDGDDMLVVYQEGALWIGYPLTRFTAFTGNWNKQGMLDFLHMLFPSMFVSQEKQLDFGGAESDEPKAEDLESWGSINSYISDTVEAAEINGVNVEAFNKFAEFEDDEVNYVVHDYNEAHLDDFEDDYDNDFNEEFEASHETSENVDTEYVSQLLEGINEKLEASISTVEECVQEAIDLASQKKGSKKLVRMMLEVEEKLTDLQKQLTTESDEE
ncbi:hypothetical protein [Bacillus sp. JJ1562]|uniref:hypothetical protein n=1 Tax=Bacillus sp. JJ1562 TaxID=3122960 RepID=UPI003002DA82